MAGSPQHVTLVAGVVTTVTFDANFQHYEVLNRDGAAEVYFRSDGNNPTVGGTGCEVLPAAISSGEYPDVRSGVTVVRLISAGAPSVSVRGLR